MCIFAKLYAPNEETNQNNNNLLTLKPKQL